MRKLRRIRAEKGLTMDALEERTGVSKRTISEIERGMRDPQTLTLAKLANALDVSLDDLLEEEAPKAPSSSPDEPKQGSEELNQETERPPVDLEGAIGGKATFSGELLVGIDAIFEDLIRDLQPKEKDRTKIEAAQMKARELASQYS